jgi:hypothetical protein
MLQGIALTSATGEKMGESKIAARQGIGMVVLSRILMASPGDYRTVCALFGRAKMANITGTFCILLRRFFVKSPVIRQMVSNLIMIMHVNIGTVYIR